MDSSVFVRDKISGRPEVFRFRKPGLLNSLLNIYRKKRISREFHTYRSSRPAGLEVFSDDRSPRKYGFLKQLPPADLYHLHWTSGFADLPDFFGKVKTPVVWTLHDQFPFTGGCHYSGECRAFITGCGRCPQLGSNDPSDLSFRILKRKLRTLQCFDKPLVIRADSTWLEKEASGSLLFKDRDTGTIHYGTDTEIFKPLNREACRHTLGIPEDAAVVVFGSPGVNNPRKGFHQLAGALEILKKDYPGLCLLSFGAGNPPSLPDLNTMHLGHVSNDRLLAIAYNCGNVFVIPSLQEAFGQTALESLACGVPVAGFRTGGIPDMIEEGRNGFLAATGNIPELAMAIAKILSADKAVYKAMSENCLLMVRQKFTLHHQAQAYLKIYMKLLNQNEQK